MNQLSTVGEITNEDATFSRVDQNENIEALVDKNEAF